MRMLFRMRRTVQKLTGLVAAAIGLAVWLGPALGNLGPAVAQARIIGPTPIQHVVIIYQENHSFDNVLGKLCVLDNRCNGATTGVLPDGQVIPLRRASDIVEKVEHLSGGQRTAIDDGKMDGFSKIGGCGPANHYQCYTQYHPSQVPNLSALARHFNISDRTFSMSPISSWGAHLELVAQTLDGFIHHVPQDIPKGLPGQTVGPGWGCDSNKDVSWQPSPTAATQLVPSCVPDYSLDPALYPFGGAYKATPVKHVPTIMDRLDAAGLSWRLYATGGPGGSPYGWAICPTFAGCLYTAQHNNQMPSEQVISDAQAGTLPNFSVVLPSNENSQHNGDSMLQGDNWIGSVVSAIQDGVQWPSTAIFITYDDCGCFYDHGPPPSGWGIRVPMVIVSPWAKPGHRDPRRASFSSMLAFTEHNFGLPPLTSRDAPAYDYQYSFDFTAPPSLAKTRLTHSPIPAWEARRIKKHPADPDDPT
jgi:Phosphoesterase family